MHATPAQGAGRVLGPVLAGTLRLGLVAGVGSLLATQAPQAVPLFVLRVPVRYYRAPPSYFRPWRADAPPRWGEHWGGDWERNRSGWDRWDHRAVPAPAPLPAYQRRYSQDRYPQQVEQQQKLHGQNYRYQPHDPVVRQQQPGPRESHPPQQDREQPHNQGRGQKPDHGGGHDRDDKRGQ